MADERPSLPPPQVPIQGYTTPVNQEGFFSERVDYSRPEYRPIQRGTKYSTILGADPNVIDQFSELYFLRETREIGAYPWATRFWATDTVAEDSYNSAVEYALEAIAFPAYTRVYTVRRDSYEANTTLAPLSTLTSVIAIKVTDGGQDYTQATIEIDDSVGSDATAEAVIDADGTIASIVVTNCGQDYTSAPTVTITGDGGGAVAIAIIQPQSAVLVSQKKTEFPDEKMNTGGAAYMHPLKNEYVIITRVYETLPGPTVTSTRLDPDGINLSISSTRGLCSDINTGEVLNGGFWIKTTKKETDNVLICEQLQETRAIPGNPMVKTVIDQNGDIMTETRTMVVGPPTLVTTNVILAGVWTKTFGEPISELVSWKVVQVRTTQNSMDSYEVFIPDLLPREFAAGLPITTHEEIVKGTASLPTLVLGDLLRSQAQLDAYTYKLTVKGRAGISLPQVITNKEITSQFGGGDVTITVTLNLFNTLTLDEGLMVLSSEIIHIDNVANGLAVKTSRIVDGVAWPILHQTHVDPKYDLIVNVEKQTVDAGTVGSVITNGTIEVQPHDKWKSIQFTSVLDVGDLPEDVVTYSGKRHSFVPELVDAVIDWAFAECGCSFSFSANLISNINQYSGDVKMRMTEQFYDGPPPDDVTITQFFPQSHHFGFAWASTCGSTDGDCRTKSGSPEFYLPLCLHDDLTLTIGTTTFTFPATSPAVLPHGSYIMLAPHVERWRFGVFRRVLIEVLVP